MRSYLTKKSKKPYQYPYFRSIVPKDLKSQFGGITDFRLSLSSVRSEDRQILCLELKHIKDEIFTEIKGRVEYEYPISGRYKRHLTDRSSQTNQTHSTLCIRDK